MEMSSANLAFARFGLGARPGDLARLGDARTALIAELQAYGVVSEPGLGLAPHAQIVHALRGQSDAQRNAIAQGVRRSGQFRDWAQETMGAERALRIRQAGAAPIGFVERLVAFWSNHFAIDAKAGRVSAALAGAFEREAIRPHLLGTFGDMLVAVTSHPAMLDFLNNQESVGPDSAAGRRTGKGLNENHARELLELHTLGVDGGYGQDDVTSLARVLTGWRTELKGSGSFGFNDSAHQPGPQTVLGKVYDQAGMAQGLAVLADLAINPNTARHVTGKLARHFVGDMPAPELLDSLAALYLETGGNLSVVAASLVLSDHAWQPALNRLKSPQEFVWSAARALSVELDDAAVQSLLEGMGQPLWYPPSPAGYPDTAMAWLGPEAMTARLDAAQMLVSLAPEVSDPGGLAEAVLGSGLSPATRQAMDRAESRGQALVLMLMSPEFQRR